MTQVAYFIPAVLASSHRLFHMYFSIGEQQAKATPKDGPYPSRDVNLAPITEDEELPSGNPNDDEEVRDQIGFEFYSFLMFHTG